jgi:hypothetical protein
MFPKHFLSCRENSVPVPATSRLSGTLAESAERQHKIRILVNMELVPAGILYWPIGWLYLWFRYRTKAKVSKALIEKYENKYEVAGALLLWKSFGLVFLSLVFLLILAAIFATIKFGIS